MTNKLIFTFFCVLLFQLVNAQQNANDKKKYKFHSLLQLGSLEGEASSAFHVQIVNGIQAKNVFLGVGVGIDQYKYRSIPLFVSLRKYIGNSKNQFFIYGDAGINYVWKKNEEKPFFLEEKKYKPKLYSNIGVGYKITIKNNNALLLSIGHSYKKVSEWQKKNFCGVVGPCTIQSDVFNYNLNRLILQIGWMF